MAEFMRTGAGKMVQAGEMVQLPGQLPHLSRRGPSRLRKDAIPCLALAHNEANIIGPFLEHYRALGPVSFIIVDDHSTDGTREFLEAQPDVTIYQPVPGSTYARDKRAWRSEILDACADGRWCLAPDIDEHLVWRGMANTSLPELIGALEEEGAEALLCIMVDMYADKPLAEHVFPGGTLADLRQAFPLFDRLEGWNYRFIMTGRKSRKKFPTPQRYVSGGLYERLISTYHRKPAPLQRFFLARYADLSTSQNLTGREYMINLLARRFLRPFHAGPRRNLNLTKLTLIRWRKGMQFFGGAHSVNRRLQLSERRGALLHYRFTRGGRGLRYLAERGQHARGGAYYRQLLDDEGLARSPVGEASTGFRDDASLGPLLRW